MRHPILALLLAAALLAPAPAALAQDTPFGPVPTPEPTIEPVPGAEDDVSRTTLYLIAGGVLVAVVGIGYAIARDARRSLPAEEREALEREERGERGTPGVSKEARARAKKQRQKVKAARRARRRNRPGR